MPPLPSVPNVIKVAVKGTYTSGYNWANVFHWTYGGTPPSPSACATLAAQIFNTYGGQFLQDMPPIQSMTDCVVTDLSSPTGGEGTFHNVTAGQSTADKLPGNVCTLVSKTIFQRYRGGHPRTYLPIGTDENLADQAHWNSAFVTHVTATWQSFVDSVVGLSDGGATLGQECAVSYYETDYTVTPHRRVRRAVPVVYDIAIDGYTIRAELASQRRRIGRRR